MGSDGHAVVGVKTKFAAVTKVILYHEIISSIEQRNAG